MAGGQGGASLLFIVGSDRPERLTIRGSKFQLAGSTDIYKLLGRGEPRDRLQMTPNYFRQPLRPELDGYSCLLNLITEPEQNTKVLENLRKLFRGLPGKVVNRPEAVLRSTRDQVARRLDGIAGLQYPIILREAGTHTGKIVGCFDTADALKAALDGKGDRIATEFVDFRSEDGLYRKYRLFFFGRRTVLRHMLTSDGWNVHAKDRRRFMLARPELIDEERRLFEDPENPFPPAVAAVFEAVRERMDLDFFGMDFGFGRDGRIVLFEANATMNFFPFLPEPELAHVLRCGPPAEAAFRELLGLPPRRRGWYESHDAPGAA